MEMNPAVKKLLTEMRNRKRLLLELQAAKTVLLQLKDPDKKLLAQIDSEISKLSLTP